MARSILFACVTILCSFVATNSVPAQIDVYSDGTDGVLSFGCCGSTTIDLSQAITGNWYDPVAPEDAGKGIYDPNVWAIVYKFESVSVDRRNLYFNPHPSGAPVVFLVQNDATFSGAALYLNANGFIAGPGGFNGGKSVIGNEPASAGLGPGGGGTEEGQPGSGAGYATVGDGVDPGIVYGNAGVFPLIGGSGGSGSDAAGYTGGGGGGAILIAVGGKLTMNSSIYANGTSPNQFNSAGGSGGAIRLVADEIVGDGNLQALGGRSGNTLGGGDGRIRIEANDDTLITEGQPQASRGVPQNPVNIFPDPTVPVIRSVSLGGDAVPADPRPLGVDLTFSDPGIYELVIQAENVPTSSTLNVRVTPRRGEEFNVAASFQSGNTTSSTWTASLDLPDGASNIIVRAEIP